MKRAPFLQWGTPAPQFYKSILMRANPTLHEEAFAFLRSLVGNKGRVIDVGSGQGAFAARMRDAGYVVTSADKNVEDFRATGVDFVPVDFNSLEQVVAFKQKHGGIYDVAVGMEVIEHVENPWEYCRLLLSLVKPGGIVLITTPNVESAYSRISFLFSGLFEHFTTEDYNDSGYINPVTVHELEVIANGIGAKLIQIKILCRLPWLVISRRPLNVFKSVLSSLFRPFMGWKGQGDIICIALERNRSESFEAVA